MNNSEHLLKFVRYNFCSGRLFWRKSPGGGIRANASAGHHALARGKPVFMTLRFRGKLYLSHRVIWRIVTGSWPGKGIDHKDLNPWNNKFSNLREATQVQNCANVRVRRNSVSGLKGVGFNKHAGKYKAKIKIGPKQKHLGYFSDPLEAHAAYCRAAKEVFGEFARSN